MLARIGEMSWAAALRASLGILSGPGAFFLGTAWMTPSISHLSTSWGTWILSCRLASPKSPRSASTGVGKNRAARRSAFAWKSMVGAWSSVPQSGGSWGVSGGLFAFFLAHLAILQRSPVFVFFLETSARNSRHALVPSSLICALMWSLRADACA